MKQLVCEVCGANGLVKQGEMFICPFCGTQYSLEAARKMMIEGTVDVTGSTVKVDNSAFVQKYLANARRAYEKEDWEEVEKYYNMVEQNTQNNMEAIFFSAYGKAMLAMTDDEYFKREQKFNVLKNSISVINDCFEETTENKQEVLERIGNAIVKMCSVNFVFRASDRLIDLNVGSQHWQKNLFRSVISAFMTELDQIATLHNEAWLHALKYKMDQMFNPSSTAKSDGSDRESKSQTKGWELAAYIFSGVVFFFVLLFALSRIG